MPWLFTFVSKKYTDTNPLYYYGDSPEWNVYTQYLKCSVWKHLFQHPIHRQNHTAFRLHLSHHPTNLPCNKLKQLSNVLLKEISNHHFHHLTRYPRHANSNRFHRYCTSTSHRCTEKSCRFDCSVFELHKGGATNYRWRLVIEF